MPLKPELKIREYEVYRAYYCGVCKSIGKYFGQLPRFGLINEAASLAIVLTCCTEKDVRPTIKMQKCIAHPVRKRQCVTSGEAIKYAACVNVLLEYHKLMDSYYDNHNIISKTAAVSIKRAYRKARRFAPILCDLIEIYMNDQQILEKNNCDSIDKAAEPTAKMLAEIFSWKDSEYFDCNPVLVEALNSFGYNMGKWIYIVDAITDIEEDMKKKQYNVLLNNSDYYKEKEISENVIFTINMCLANASSSWERVKQAVNLNENTKIRDLFAIIDNLVYLGMRNVSEKVTGGKICERSV